MCYQTQSTDSVTSSLTKTSPREKKTPFLKFKTFGSLSFSTDSKDPSLKKKRSCLGQETFIVKGFNMTRGKVSQIMCNKGTLTGN